MIIARLILAAILAFFPRFPTRQCVIDNTEAIVQHAVNAEQYGVPAGVFLIVGFAETHLGCDAGEGGGYGAPIDRFHRHTPGTPEHAARALAASYRVCHTWEGAISRFRSGQCHLLPTDPRSGYVRRALVLIPRAYRHAGVEPIDLRAPHATITVTSVTSPTHSL